HATWYLSPDQRVDVGSTAQVGFNIDSSQKESIGVLMYKLQRKSTDQPNEEATCIQLVIIWKVNSCREFLAVSFLIEHSKSDVLHEYKLMELDKYYKLFDVQYGIIEDTWLMHDNTVLMTSVNVTCEEGCYKLEM